MVTTCHYIFASNDIRERKIGDKIFYDQIETTYGNNNKNFC